MKVILINNRFRFPGGVETVVDATVDILRQKGNEVSLKERDSKELTKSPFGNFRAFTSGIYSRKAYKDVLRSIEQEKPDIVHVHNLYPLFSPSVLVACRRANVPVVMTCHTYRLVCPQGQHYDGHKICELCFKDAEYWCVIKNCKNSIFQSSAYALRNMVARKLRLFADNVTVFIALSQFAKKRLINAGYNKNRIFVLPNMVPVKSANFNRSRGRYAAFAGRLSPEKGVEHILSAAVRLPGIPVKVAGDGPIFSNLVQNAPDNIEFTGRLDPNQMSDFYRQARFLIFTSNWYEVCPMVILESLSCGLPVIAPKIGGLPELVEDYRTGLLFEPGNSKDLANKMNILWNNPELCEKMGKAARETAYSEYGIEVYYQHLMDIYENAIFLKKSI